MLPAHRKERATLEAVASTMGPEVANLNGPAAAAAYLAALITSLQRLIETTKPSLKKDKGEEEQVQQKLSKKERKLQRRKARQAEEAMKGMAGPEVHPATIKPDKEEKMEEEDGDNQESIESENVELIACLIYLVGLSAGGCSSAVLNATYEQTLTVVMKAFDHAAGSSLASRHTCTVLASVLSVVNSSAWSKPVVQRAYLYLLRQTTENDPRSRRKAREALDALLNCPRGSLIRSKTSLAASSHYVMELESNMTSFDFRDDPALKSQFIPSSYIHLLTSIERFGSYLSPLDAAKVAKELVIVSSKTTHDLASFSLLGLWSLFKAVNEKLDNTSPPKRLIPEKDLGKLVLATLEIEIPRDSSLEWKLAYISCITDGTVGYLDSFDSSRPSDDFVMNTLGRLCQIFALPDSPRELSRNAASCLDQLCKQKWARGRSTVAKALQELIRTSKSQSMPLALSSLKRYLEQDMSCGIPVMKDCVTTISSWALSKRQKAVSENEQKSRDQMNALLAAIVRGGGAGVLLSLCELKYDVKMHITNSWMMPILSENLRGAHLSIFETQFVPLAAQLTNALEACEKDERVVEAKNVGMYRTQVFGLLSGFCQNPPDLGHNGILSIPFKAMFQCMTDSKDEIGMQNCGISALRQLAVTVLSLDSEDPTSFTKVASFAGKLKKLYPCIMQLAEKLPDERRGALTDALRIACQASNNPSLIASLLRKTIKRLLELKLQTQKNNSGGAMNDDDDDNNLLMQHASADLLVAMAESKILPKEASEFEFIEKAMFPFLRDAKESSLQKKAYRITALLVGERKEDLNSADFYDFMQKLSDAGKTVAPGAKAARQAMIRSFIELYVKLSSKDQKVKLLEFVNEAFLPEIILATRETSEKSRGAAFATLVAAARAWNASDSGDDMQGLQNFFMSVAAGLGGRTVAMLAATLTSLGRLIYEFRSEASLNSNFGDMVDSLYATKDTTTQNPDMDMADDDDDESGSKPSYIVTPGPIAIMLRHDAGEVRKAALGAVKVATRALATPEGRLNQILPGIIPGLVHSSARSKNHEARLKVRVILERLLRRCGREVLEANFPEEHMKLLDAVRKTRSRELVKKHAAKEMRAARKAGQSLGEDHNALNDLSDDSDSDIERDLVDGDDLLSKRPKVRKRKSPDENDGVTDLLTSKRAVGDRAVEEAAKEGRKDLSWNPRRGRDDSFKYAEDGKPIFVESDNDSGGAEVGSDDDDNDSDDNIHGSGHIAQAVGKRGRSDRHGGDSKRRKVKGSFGEEYRGKRGAGDIKRVGKPDPYAYVPLGMDLLSATQATKKSRNATAVARLIHRNGAKRKGRQNGAGRQS